MIKQTVRLPIEYKNTFAIIIASLLWICTTSLQFDVNRHLWLHCKQHLSHMRFIDLYEVACSCDGFSFFHVLWPAARKEKFDYALFSEWVMTHWSVETSTEMIGNSKLWQKVFFFFIQYIIIWMQLRLNSFELRALYSKQKGSFEYL